MQDFHFNEVNNIHSGHRERMYERFLSGEVVFSDTELLETLLFYCIPHKDVKPLAKELLKYFATFDGVIGADTHAILKVKGVGKKTAAFLKMIDRIVKQRSGEKNEPQPVSVLSAVEFMGKFFDEETSEKLVITLLDGEGKILDNVIYSDNMRGQANLSLNDLMTQVARTKPHAAVMAHNHPSGITEPSETDDSTTRKVVFMLGMQGVQFYDHIIFCGNDYFSYHISGKLDKIKAAIVESFG